MAGFASTVGPVLLVRIESNSDPTSSAPFFAVVPPEDGQALLDADWLEGSWVSPWEDGYALAALPEMAPRAGQDLHVRVQWYPLRLVPDFPELSHAGTLPEHGSR